MVDILFNFLSLLLSRRINMPFMKGVAPIRRTKSYLEATKLLFRPEVKVVTVNYNVDQKASEGAYDFLFWHFPQIKYRNKDLQLLKFKNMTPIPCIQLFFEDGRKVVIDVYNRSRSDIHDHLLNTFCIPMDEIKEKQLNPASFGYRARRWCICEVPGQIPCPSFVRLPKQIKEMTHKRKL